MTATIEERVTVLELEMATIKSFLAPKVVVENICDWRRDSKRLCELAGFMFGVSPASISTADRSKSVTQARHLVLYAIRRIHPNITFVEMAKFFNRDHTTILYAIKKVEDSAELRTRAHGLIGMILGAARG